MEENSNLLKISEDFKTSGMDLKVLLDFNADNFLTITDRLVKFINIVNFKNTQKLSLRLSFCDNFIKMIEHNNQKMDIYYNYLVFNKIVEILRINHNPLVFITLLKNSLTSEPNYNIIPKLKNPKGYQLYKFFGLLFNNSEDMLELVKIQQILIQMELKFEDIVIGIIKTIMIDILYFIAIEKQNQNLLTKIMSLKYYNVDFNTLDEYIDYYSNLYLEHINA